MPTLSDGAARFLEATLARSAQQDAAVRLRRSASGWSLRIDRPQEGDAVFEREGRTLLVMAEEVAEELGEAVIQLRRSGARAKLVITQD